MRAEGEREAARLHRERLDHQLVLLKQAVSPALLRFSPYTAQLVVADKNRFRSGSGAVCCLRPEALEQKQGSLSGGVSVNIGWM